MADQGQATDEYEHIALLVDATAQQVKVSRDGLVLIDMPLPAPQWIPVSEGLPEIPSDAIASETVVCLQGGEATTGFYDPEDGWQNERDELDWLSRYRGASGPVTHWMPLPPAPEER